MDKKPAGTVSIIEPKFASDFPKTLSAHDIGLKDMIESVTILGTLPKIYLITVTIDTIQPMQMELSTKVKDAILEVIEKIDALVSVIKMTGLILGLVIVAILFALPYLADRWDIKRFRPRLVNRNGEDPSEPPEKKD